MIAFVLTPAFCTSEENTTIQARAAEAYKAKDFACAARLFEEALQDAPNDRNTLRYLGYAYAGLVFEREAVHRDAKTGSFELADVQAASKACHALLACHRGGDSDPQLRSCLDTLFDSPILEEEAFRILEKETKASPGNPDYWRWLAKLDDSTGRIEDAIKAGRNWQGSEPGSAEAYLFMGRLFLRQCLASRQEPAAIKRVVEDNIARMARFAENHPKEPEALRLLLDFHVVLGWYLSDKREANANRRKIEELEAQVEVCRGASPFIPTQGPSSGKGVAPRGSALDPPSYFMGPLFKADVVMPMGAARVRRPAVIRYPTPIYPAAPGLKGATGRVVVEVIVGQDGSVNSQRVLKGTSPQFDFAAIDAVGRWRFERPYATDEDGKGRFVRVYWIVTVNFAAR